MKQLDLVHRIESAGYRFYQHGKRHDIYIKDGRKVAVPRHSEIKENTARAIMKQCGLR